MNVLNLLGEGLKKYQEYRKKVDDASYGTSNKELQMLGMKPNTRDKYNENSRIINSAAGATLSTGNGFADALKYSPDGNLMSAQNPALAAPKMNPNSVGAIQQAHQMPDLTAYENAINTGNWSAAQQLAKFHPGDARFLIHETLQLLGGAH